MARLVTSILFVSLSLILIAASNATSGYWLLDSIIHRLVSGIHNMNWIGINNNNHKSFRNQMATESPIGLWYRIRDKDRRRLGTTFFAEWSSCHQMCIVFIYLNVRSLIQLNLNESQIIITHTRPIPAFVFVSKNYHFFVSHFISLNRMKELAKCIRKRKRNRWRKRAKAVWEKMTIAHLCGHSGMWRKRNTV